MRVFVKPYYGLSVFQMREMLLGAHWPSAMVKYFKLYISPPRAARRAPRPPPPVPPYGQLPHACSYSVVRSTPAMSSLARSHAMG